MKFTNWGYEQQKMYNLLKDFFLFEFRGKADMFN